MVSDGFVFGGGGGGISAEDLASDTITADGTEQVLINQDLSNYEVTGYINLDNMQIDDKITLRTYRNGIAQAISQYSDALAQPMIVLTPLILGKGDNFKVTIEQTATGTDGYKNIPYTIIGRA